jgi:hypothetical protein
MRNNNGKNVAQARVCAQNANQSEHGSPAVGERSEGESLVFRSTFNGPPRLYTNFANLEGSRIHAAVVHALTSHFKFANRAIYFAILPCLQTCLAVTTLSLALPAHRHRLSAVARKKMYARAPCKSGLLYYLGFLLLKSNLTSGESRQKSQKMLASTSRMDI